MFFKPKAFICCVRNKYCAITKFPIYLLPLKERLMCQFFFPLFVCVFISFFSLTMFYFLFFLSMFLFPYLFWYLWKFPPVSGNFHLFYFIYLFFAHFLFACFCFQSLLKIFASQPKLPPEARSHLQTFFAPLDNSV